MKKLIFAVTLITSLVAFSAEKSYEEQYAEAKAGLLPDTMRAIATKATNETWKTEAYAVGRNIFDTMNPSTLTDKQYYDETAILDWMVISKKTLTKAEAKTWIIDARILHCSFDLIVHCDDANFTLCKKYLAAKEYKQCISYAIYTTNADILIDAGLNANFNACNNVTLMTKYLSKLSVIDASYRESDVVKILKNMNQVFTMKMYEAGKEETYKPLVTKIRALLELH